MKLRKIFAASKTPTPAQLEAASLIEVTTWQEIDTAIENGQGPARTYDATTKKFPPITTAYVSKPVPVPGSTFSAKQVAQGEVEVAWSGFEPVLIGRNGIDTSGFANWNTGPLTNQPTSGTFQFDYLVPDDTYIFTITQANGSTQTATVTVTASVAPTLPTLGMNGSTGATQLAQMQSLGVKLVRTQITWNYADEWDGTGGIPFYNADGTFNTAITEKANAIKTLAELYGITILFLIDGFISSAPTVPAGAGNYTPGLPYSPGAYAAACAWFCSQVEGAHIEGPNEPDGYAQWNGSVPFLASDYAIALPLVYAQCKAADPTCNVHIAPVSGVQPGTGGYDWRAALGTVLPTYADHIDTDGYHEYTYPINEPFTTEAGWAQTFITAFIKGKFWKTEFGFPSFTTNSGDNEPEASPAFQSENLVAAIQADALLKPAPEAIFIYCLSDYDNPNTTDGRWGLIDSAQTEGDTNPKPAFAAIQNLFAPTKGS